MKKNLLAVLVLGALCILGAPKMHAQNVMLVSGMGAKCLNASGGNHQGADMIGYRCGNGQSNEIYWFSPNPDGTFRITQGNLCLDIKGGLGRPNDTVDMWPCNGQVNQKWRYVNHQIVGQNGLCLDLRGGTDWTWWNGNQPAIVYPCNGQKNQQWYKGVVVAQNRVRLNAAPVQPGQQAPMAPINLAASNVIAAGGGNVIAAGGGNVIASGAGNVIASGAGNVIAAGGGNVIAAGGGNLIVLAQ